MTKYIARHKYKKRKKIDNNEKIVTSFKSGFDFKFYKKNHRNLRFRHLYYVYRIKVLNQARFGIWVSCQQDRPNKEVYAIDSGLFVYTYFVTHWETG